MLSNVGARFSHHFGVQTLTSSFISTAAGTMLAQELLQRK